MNTPIDYQTAKRVIDSFGIPDFGKATIREVVAISTQLEQETGTEFIHMEMGVPGLRAAQVGVEAEIKALQDGVASIYPNINGIPEVKEQAARFIKAFINVDINPVLEIDLGNEKLRIDYHDYDEMSDLNEGDEVELIYPEGNIKKITRYSKYELLKKSVCFGIIAFIIMVISIGLMLI